MLATGQVAATLAVSDVERARKFYTETLGFTPMMEDPAMGTLYGGGKGTMLKSPTNTLMAYMTTIVRTSPPV